MRSREQSDSALDVLIADDDPATRRVLRRLLEHEGYRCAEADNGVEAVQIAGQCSPRLFLLDVMMPDADGFHAARQLRANAETKRTPILFLTGRDDPQVRETARRFRPQTLLTKPVRRDELLDVVTVVINSNVWTQHGCSCTNQTADEADNRVSQRPVQP